MHFKNKIIFNFIKFMDIKKEMSTNFFSPLSFVAFFRTALGVGGSYADFVKDRLFIEKIRQSASSKASGERTFNL
jgi:hypothetical protein